MESPMTWGDVWRMTRNYRPDWFDLGIVWPGLIGAVVLNSWYAGWSLRSWIVGPLCALLGFMAVSVLYPLWYSDR
jgi:hypothetical protein